MASDDSWLEKVLLAVDSLCEWNRMPLLSPDGAGESV